MISGAANSTTVDWTPWLALSPEQQDALWRNYRRIVKAESDAALANNYARVTAAIRAVRV
jgi:hypothetical protein